MEPLSPAKTAVPKNASPKSPQKTLALPLQTLLIAGSVALLLMAALYFGGLFQGRAQGTSQLAAQKTQYDKQILGLQSETQKAKADLAASQNLNHIMEARGSLYRTSVDLDQRNFGTANTHLQEAAVFLSNIKTGDGGIPVAQIDALRSSIAQTNINVAADLETQRTRVLDFAAQLDALIPATPASAAPETPAP